MKEALPKISIVTPSYNQGHFLEETILSILNQEYPYLEFIIMDGGSTDSSVDIIKKYSSHIAYWVSQQDKGQAAAINEGFRRSTGDIIAWVNSDDVLFPGALMAVAKEYKEHQGSLIVGNGQWYFQDFELVCDQIVRNVSAEHFIQLSSGMLSWCQPGTFFPRSILTSIGYLDESLRYVFDRDWMCKLLLTKIEVRYINQSLARFRFHSMSKTIHEGEKWANEQVQITARYSSFLPTMNLHFETAALKVIYQAQPSLSFLRGSINRMKGLSTLFNIFKENKSVLLFPRFTALILFSLLPLELMKFITVKFFGLKPSKRKS